MKKLLMIIVICLALQFWLMSKTVVYGDSLSGLEKKIALIKGENQRLELKIASQISCSAIAREATEAGFVSIASLSQPAADLSVALRR